MAKKKPKTWVYSPPKPAKVAVPESVKAEVERKADELVETVLKPKYVKKPPKNPKFNYLTDITTKWHSGSFYFVPPTPAPARTPFPRPSRPISPG
jgi:hypothetical protein